MNHSNSSSESYEYNPLVAKYEEMRYQQKSFYLDPYEFIEVSNFYLNQLNYKEAKKALLNGLKIHKSNINILIELAHLYLELEDIENVKKTLLQLEGIHLFDVDAIRAEVLLIEEENDDKAQQILSHSINPSDIDQGLTVAQLFLIYQFPDRALSWLLPIYNREKENIEILELISRSYLMKLDFKKAADTYNKLLNIAPYHTDYWNKLGHCYYLDDKFESAQEAYSFALTCDKENDEAYIFGALSLLHQDRVNEANSLLNKAIKENILFLEHKYYYLSLFYYTQREDVENAYRELLKGFENIRKESGYYVLCYYFLFSLCLIRLGKYTEANKCCLEARKIYNKLPNTNIENQWTILPSLKQFEELSIICEKEYYSPAELYINYTRQLISLLNPISWSDEGNPLLLIDTHPLSEFYKPVKLTALINKKSDQHNQLDKIYFEMLLDSEKVLTETTGSIEVEQKNAKFFKKILDNNPNLAANWKKDIKNLIQNN